MPVLANGLVRRISHASRLSLEWCCTTLNRGRHLNEKVDQPKHGQPCLLMSSFTGITTKDPAYEVDPAELPITPWVRG